MSTYGDAWKALVSIAVPEKKKYSKSIGVDRRDVHIAGREEDATPKVFALLSFPFIKACQSEVYIWRSLGAGRKG